MEGSFGECRLVIITFCEKTLVIVKIKNTIADNFIIVFIDLIFLKFKKYYAHKDDI